MHLMYLIASTCSSHDCMPLVVYISTVIEVELLLLLLGPYSCR